MMFLYIPKVVVVHNKWLTRLFYLMVIGTGTGMLTWFVGSGGYMSSVSLRETVHLNMWVNEPSDDALNETLTDRMGDVCGYPKDYDYWYDDYWRYDGATCINVTGNCSPNRRDCLRTRDVYVKESPRELYFSTYYKPIMHDPTGAKTEIGRYYVPQINAFTVHFEYFFTAPRLPMFTDAKSVTRPAAEDEERLTNKEVMTVFLDANRDIDWIAEPGDSLEISIPTLLRLAGYETHLHTPHAKWGANAMPGAVYPEGPIGMIGGVPVELNIHCHKWPKKRLGEGYEYWTGPTCYVAAHGQEIWSTKYRTNYLADGGMLDLDSSGIRVTGQMDGTWEYFDVNNCILNFTALLVLLEAPRRIIIWITCWALGHLSSIYRKAIFQKFIIGQQIAGMTARICTYGASFRELEHSDRLGGLTRAGLYDTMSHVTRYRRISEVQRAAAYGSEDQGIFGQPPSQRSIKAAVKGDDVMLFADFAFKALCDPRKWAGGATRSWLANRILRTKCWRIVEAVLEGMFGNHFLAGIIEEDGKDGVTDDNSRVSVDNFLSAAVSSEPASFEDLMWLFNKDRKVGLLERLFTPKDIAEHLVPERMAMGNEYNGEEDGDEEDGGTPRSSDPGDLDLLDHVTRMANNARNSNRALITSYVQSNQEVVGDLQAASTCLREDLQRVQEACARLTERIDRRRGSSPRGGGPSPRGSQSEREEQAPDRPPSQTQREEQAPDKPSERKEQASDDGEVAGAPLPTLLASTEEALGRGAGSSLGLPDVAASHAGVPDTGAGPGEIPTPSVAVAMASDCVRQPLGQEQAPVRGGEGAEGLPTWSASRRCGRPTDADAGTMDDHDDPPMALRFEAPVSLLHPPSAPASSAPPQSSRRCDGVALPLDGEDCPLDPQQLLNLDRTRRILERTIAQLRADGDRGRRPRMAPIYL